jgi:hypothetical protein
MTQAIDSGDRIPAQEAKAAHFAGGVRYLSNYPSKNLSHIEWVDDQAAGFPVALVYEDGAEDALGGANAGTAKAAVASPLLSLLGWPKGRPVYFACDFNPSPDQYQLCWEAINAFATSLGRPPAAYACWPLLAYCEKEGLEFGWALGSSSFNTGPAPTRLVLQQLDSQVRVGAATCDVNDVLAVDWGQVPAPLPFPTPKVVSERIIFPHAEGLIHPTQDVAMTADGKCFAVPDEQSKSWLVEQFGYVCIGGTAQPSVPCPTVPPASLVAAMQG